MAGKKITLDGKVEVYFTANPKKKVVYSTSDEFLFETKKYATDHAKSLSDDDVATTHKNPKLIEVVEETKEEE